MWHQSKSIACQPKYTPASLWDGTEEPIDTSSWGIMMEAGHIAQPSMVWEGTSEPGWGMWGAVGGDRWPTGNQPRLGMLACCRRNILLGMDGEKEKLWGFRLDQVKISWCHVASGQPWASVSSFQRLCSLFIKWRCELCLPGVIVKNKYRRCKASSSLPPPPPDTTKILGSCTEGKIKLYLQWSQRAVPTPLFLIW